MKLQIKRWISQILFFITANLGVVGIKTGFCFPFFYCHACPASSAACPIRSLEISVSNASKNIASFSIQLLMYPLLILLTVGLLSGRAVCGWACPLGMLQRVTAKSARYLKKRFPKLKSFDGSKPDRMLRYAKYVVLISLVFIIPFLIGFMFTDICPNGLLFGTIPVMLLNPGKYVPASYFYPALVIFILFLILIFVIERGWCRYFCPVGALLAPFNKVSYLYVDVNKDECIKCNACSNVCPMAIDVPEMNRDPECIYCGKCVSACPKNIVNFRRLGKNG